MVYRAPLLLKAFHLLIPEDDLWGDGKGETWEELSVFGASLVLLYNRVLACVGEGSQEIITVVGGGGWTLVSVLS